VTDTSVDDSQRQSTTLNCSDRQSTTVSDNRRRRVSAVDCLSLMLTVVVRR